MKDIKHTSALQHKISNRPVYYAVLVVKRAIGNGRDTLLTSAQGTKAWYKLSVIQGHGVQ